MANDVALDLTKPTGRLIGSDRYSTDIANIQDIKLRRSSTYFVGLAGEEKADYTYNFVTSGNGAGETVKTVSVNYYGDTAVRAPRAVPSV